MVHQGPLKVGSIQCFSCTIPTGRLYTYPTDLIFFNFCRRAVGHIPPQLETVSTPLAVTEWARVLTQHPDRAFARYICTGLMFGFRIRFSGTITLRSAPVNSSQWVSIPQSSRSTYLAKELALGRMLGPFNDTSQLPPLQVNRIGVIPKGHNTPYH